MRVFNTDKSFDTTKKQNTENKANLLRSILKSIHRGRERNALSVSKLDECFRMTF